jgi:hypothetical protein
MLNRQEAFAALLDGRKIQRLDMDGNPAGAVYYRMCGVLRGRVGEDKESIATDRDAADFFTHLCNSSSRWRIPTRKIKCIKKRYLNAWEGESSGKRGWCMYASEAEAKNEAAQSLCRIVATAVPCDVEVEKEVEL